MILASVTTCPKRWVDYQRLRRSFGAHCGSISLRTFQTDVSSENPRINNNLNARAALAFARKRLPEQRDSWLLYLEDDVALSEHLPAFLNALRIMDPVDEVDCWYLCNRRNPVGTQFRRRGFVLNELKYPIRGTHALLLNRVLLDDLLQTSWHRYADEVLFPVLEKRKTRVWQIVQPVLTEHVGEYSTFTPTEKMKLEINYANTSNTDQAAG